MESATSSSTEDHYRIFLVDDDADDREFFSEALKEVGRNVRLAVFSSGDEVLNELRSGETLPDIIFLDLYMPRMDGRECLAKIRSDARLNSVCVIMYSTLMNLHHIDELFDAGANRFLKKPSSYPALKNALDKAIESVTNNPLGGQTVINYSE
jgi:CheY-like chemotaxis protein